MPFSVSLIFLSCLLLEKEDCMSELTVFHFEENQVRTVMINGEPWFVGKDVCDALDLKNSRDALNSLDEDDKKTVVISDGNRGNPNMTVVNESGLYDLIFSSRKTEARKFKRWVTKDVLPTLRKENTYSLDHLSPEEILLKQCQRLVENKRRLEKVEKTSTEALSVANDAKEGLENVRNELTKLQEFSVAQPEGLDQNQADLIKQAFQSLGAVLNESGVEKPKCYSMPWKDLGLTMRNSSINYDLNARFSNEYQRYKKAFEQWKINGKPKGQKPVQPTRVSVLLRDNRVADAFKAAQQVVQSHLSRILG